MLFSKNNTVSDEVDIMSAYMLLSMWLASVLMDIADDLCIVRPNPVDMLMFDCIAGNKFLFRLNKKESASDKVLADTKRFCKYIKTNLCTSEKHVTFDVKIFEHETHYFCLLQGLLHKPL